MKRFPSGAVIVTGAAQGIGRRLALTLVEEGVDVCVADWNDEKGKAVAVEKTPGIGRRIFVKTDVADEASCKAAVEAAVATFGGVFGLVNNASIFSTLIMRPFWEIPSDEWDRYQKSAKCIRQSICPDVPFAIAPTELMDPTIPADGWVSASSTILLMHSGNSQSSAETTLQYLLWEEIRRKGILWFSITPTKSLLL